ncbi:lysozyme inhibitor LprI family protein [Thiothrix lacustris]|uniref:lysozyme inhibitor LprI family protein n=1 Tax=Thiothrix lacustris TaxID=525917 RepID=UPI0027E54D10|nr:lysozyme inhibitor LprI family protein [Thiothrix lacustris]WMP16418.1 lysozyme inhibitor LprI family protein [Thiothrix lacustris]
MANNLDNSGRPEVVQRIIIEKNTSNAMGIASFIFGIIGIFFLAPIFVPLSLLFGILAVISKQLAWGIMGIVCAIIGFITSPILLGLFGLITIASSIDSNSINTAKHNIPPIIQEASFENDNSQKIKQPQIAEKTKEPIQNQKPIDYTNINTDSSSNNISIEPSFECDKASTFIEKTICSNQNLADIDNAMANLYKNALSGAVNPEKIKKDQRAWLKNNRNKCSDTECLEREYSNRIEALNSSYSFDEVKEVETIGYGSRAGMNVNVLSKKGLDTDNAIIKTEHTTENAIEFCREYGLNVNKECINDVLDTKLNEYISANCKTGLFTDFSEGTFEFQGKNNSSNYPEYMIYNYESGEIADGTSVSNYGVNLEIYKALCPKSFK